MSDILLDRRREMSWIDRPQKNNEIWYTTTNHKKIASKTYCPGSGTLLYHYYSAHRDRGVIGYSNNITNTLYFDSCTNLKTITLPDTVTALARQSGLGGYVGCFSNCSNLTTVYSQPLASLSQAAFYKCSKLKSIGYGQTKSEQTAGVNLSNSITTIPAQCFRDCTSLPSDTIDNLGSSITTLGNYAFYGLGKENWVFFNIHIPEGVTTLGSGCVSSARLEDIYLPSTITTISGGLGPGIHIHGIYFTEPNSNFKIENGILMDANGKTIYLGLSHWNTSTVTIPDSVTTWHQYSLYQFNYVSKLIIGSGISSINSYTASGPSNAGQEIYIRRTSSVVSLSSTTGNGFITTASKIYVPESLVDSYKTATNWKNYASKIYGYTPT